MSCILIFISLGISILVRNGGAEPPPERVYRPFHCPRNWVQKKHLAQSDFTCYKFVRSPKKSHTDAKSFCQTYHADLMTLSTNDEYTFMVRYLHENDPLYRTWYIGVVQTALGHWENEGGGVLPEPIKDRFHSNQVRTVEKKYLAFSYSFLNKEWGLLTVEGVEPSEFVCEVQSNRLSQFHLDADEVRDYEYGVVVNDLKYLPRGPKFIHQPEATMFDLLKRDVINHIAITCLADGFPAPTYKWYKEEYKANQLESKEIDPLVDSRITVSGGTLIINHPKEIEDRGSYYCVAENKFGSVVSESVQLSFAYMAEFNLKRSDETGNQNWGKAIYCDPPRYFPDARFYWSRDFFPNFVDEDKRTLVSFDGNLYFSYLDNIDEGRYSCTVQSTVSDIGRHGPFFNLRVFPHPNFQQLKFANNFPKAFPDSPIRGDEVRLECIAFGYPVPSYNWTRRNGPLPRDAQLKNYNRVLILPRIEPADVGDYICRAQNDRMSIEATVSLSIQATPRFTIPLQDLFISEGEDLMLECESFAIPDVKYTWLKDSIEITSESMDANDMNRYNVTDNVLRIKAVKNDDEGVFQCKATNQLSSSFSSAELRVLKLAPTFQKRPLDPEIYAAVGTNITIKCRPEAAPAPQFEWRKNGLKIGRGGRLDILRNGDLIITMVTRDDQGVYKCTATNMYGTDHSTGHLFVLDELYFTTDLPEEEVVSVGDTLKLACNAKADEILDLAYVWLHNELRIHVDVFQSADDIDNIITNYVTDFYSRRQLNDGLALETIERAQDALGYIAAREPNYQRGHHPGSLIIPDITLEDAGFYRCNAKTPIANISQVVKVVVIGPPGPPGGVTALSLTSTTATIRWTNGATNGGEFLYYTIQGKTLFTHKWKMIAENVIAKVIDQKRSRMEYSLPERSLTPWASYRFRIQATNAFGTGIYSETSPTANTQQDVPFKAPSNVGGGGGKTGDLTITWDPLPLEDQNAPGVYYRVFWRRYIDPNLNRKPDLFKKIILKGDVNKNMFVASIQLEYFYTLYEVKVQAANSKGWGPESGLHLIYSAEGMPQVQPTEVKAFAHNATSMNITWQPIESTREDIRGKLIGFRLKYWREIDSEAVNSQIRLKLGTEPHGLIVGLVPNTFYWVRVMAYNSAGSGPESEKFRERTWRNPPLTPPNAVNVVPIDPETIYVKWRGITPTPIEEALLGYKVRIWESDQDMTSANDTIVPLGTDLEAYINGLQVGKRYMLRVLAYSLGGDGKMSSPPWHFIMGDPERLRAIAQEQVLSFHLVYLLPLVIFLKR